MWRWSGHHRWGLNKTTKRFTYTEKLDAVLEDWIFGEKLFSAVFVICRLLLIVNKKNELPLLLMSNTFKFDLYSVVVTVSGVNKLNDLTFQYFY